MMTQPATPRKRIKATPPPVADEEKRPRGRPTKPPEEKLVGRSIRLYPSLWEKIDQYGMEWARKVLARAKPPQE